MGVTEPLAKGFGAVNAKSSSKMRLKTNKNKDNKPIKADHTWFRKGMKQKNKETNLAASTSSRKAEKKKLTERRKRQRKPHFDLEKEIAILWEKLRQRNLKTEERSRLISEILEKMKGKIPEMASSHIASRVLQTCTKHCRADERDIVFKELRPHFLALARNTYAHHLVTKMLDQANKNQLQQMITSLHGNVVTFLRHPVASAVVEHAYKLANGPQKRDLVSEFFSPEHRIFKGITAKGDGRLTSLLVNETSSKRASVLQHMTTSLQPILEKGIVDHSIIHRALVEYLSVASKTTTCEVAQQLSGPLLIRMIHTKDGAKVGVICIACGGRKERKKIIKGLKGHATKAAFDEYGNLVLLAILDVVDDTKLVNKFVIKDLMKDLKGLALHKYGRRVLLHLLSPHTPRYFSPDVQKALQTPFSFPDQTLQCREHLSDFQQSKSEPLKGAEGDSSDIETNFDPNKLGKQTEDSGMQQNGDDDTEEMKEEATGISKKDPFVRRLELLTNSGLAENLTEVCTNHAGELLRSPFGKDVIYEVAKGGSGGVMWQAMPTGVTSVHKAIAELAALPQVDVQNAEDSEEHVLEQYHSSRIIRRMIMDCSPPPDGIQAASFSSILWDIAFSGKCEQWAKGHSEKVVSAFWECADLKVRSAAKIELQQLIDSGFLQNSSIITKKQGTKRKR